MQKCFAINGMGNTGCSLLVKIAEEISQGKEPQPIIAAHDLFVSRDRIIASVNSAVYGETSIKLTSKGSHTICIGSHEIEIIPATSKTIGWKNYGVWGVIEATGSLLNRQQNQEIHLRGGAEKVIITAPSVHQKVKSIIYGYNEHLYEQESDVIIDNSSCTTRAVIHVINALLKDNQQEIERISLDILHPKTRDKRHSLLEKIINKQITNEDFNLTNRTTSSADSLKKILEKEIVIQANALELPALDISHCYITVEFSKPTTKNEIAENLINSKRETIFNIKKSFSDFTEISNDPHDSIVISDSILQIDTAARVWKVAVLFDNRYAAACAAYRMLGCLLEVENGSSR